MSTIVPHAGNAPLLVVCAEPPYPPTSGTPLRTWQTISIATRTRRVDVLSIGAAPAESMRVPGVTAWSHVVVDPTESPDTGFPLLRGTASLVAFDAALADAVARTGPRTVLFSNVWPERPPTAISARRIGAILDLHNAYAAYARERGADASTVARIEAAAVASVDCVWTCSDDDARAIRASSPTARVVAIPNGVDLAAYDRIRDARPRARDGSFTLLFVGSFWYEPNRLAAQTLVGEIFPRVRAALPKARLVLVGAAPTQDLRAAADADPAIVVTGRVPDVRPFLAAADVVAAPLAFGGGTRFKLLEAFAAGRPVVATAKAAQGLAGIDGVQLMLRETPESIAAAVVELARNPDLRTRIAAAGHRLATESYGWDALEPLVLASLDDLGTQV